MLKNRSVPADIILPHLVYQDVDVAVTWLTKAFGFKEHYRYGKIVEELHETVYGELQYGVKDLEGHHWLFSRHARDVSPDVWGATLVEK